MKAAYKEVIESLKQQLKNATGKLSTKSSKKQIPVNKSFNKLNVSDIMSNHIIFI